MSLKSLKAGIISSSSGSRSGDIRYYATGETGDGSVYSTFTPVSAGNFDLINYNGFSNTCFLSGTKLFVTGNNSYGQLGIGSSATNIAGLVQVPGQWTYAAFGGRSLYALSGKDLYVAGYNGYGEIGLGPSVLQINTLTKLDGSWDYVFPSPGGIETINYAFAVSGLKLFAAGSNINGQLGLGDYLDKSYFTEVPGSLEEGFIKVACGQNHALVLNNNKLYSCGLNTAGQLGRFTPTPPFPLTNKSFDFVQVPGTWIDIAVGRAHSVALSSNSTVFCCGRNDRGQLGRGFIGNNDFVLTPVFENVSKVYAAENTSFAQIGKLVYASGSTARNITGLIPPAPGFRDTFTRIYLEWDYISPGQRGTVGYLFSPPPPSPTSTPNSTPTNTPSITPSSTNTPTPTPTLTNTPTTTPSSPSICNSVRALPIILGTPSVIGYGNGKWLVFYDNEISVFAESTNDGFNWTLQNLNTINLIINDYKWTNIKYENNTWIVTCRPIFASIFNRYIVGLVSYSNGDSWDYITVESANFTKIVDIAFGEDKWVATTDTNTYLLSSIDNDWQTLLHDGSNAEWLVEFGSFQFLILDSSTNTNVGFISNDGINWSPTNPVVSMKTTDLIFDGNNFLAIGDDSNQLSYSPDGVSWFSSLISNSITTNYKKLLYDSSSNRYIIYRNTSQNLISYNLTDWFNFTVFSSNITSFASNNNEISVGLIPQTKSVYLLDFCQPFPTRTPTTTLTPTKTPTSTRTPTPTFTPTNSLTPSRTPTNTVTPSFTPTVTPTRALNYFDNASFYAINTGINNLNQGAGFTAWNASLAAIVSNTPPLQSGVGNISSSGRTFCLSASDTRDGADIRATRSYSGIDPSAPGAGPAGAYYIGLTLSADMAFTNGSGKKGITFNSTYLNQVYPVIYLEFSTASIRIFDLGGANEKAKFYQYIPNSTYQIYITPYPEYNSSGRTITVRSNNIDILSHSINTSYVLNTFSFYFDRTGVERNDYNNVYFNNLKLYYK